MLHTDDKTLEFNVEKLFVCSGSFSSTKIANNMIGGEKFSIEDSELSVWPILKFGKKLKSKSKKLQQFILSLRIKQLQNCLSNFIKEILI